MNDKPTYKELENHSNNNLIDGKYKFSDLIEINQLKEIFSKFSKATGYTIGLVDNNSLEVLVSTGWHDICMNFHRADEKACNVCKESNKILFSDLEQKKTVKIVECKHGLYDCATPIIIEDKHVANLVTGQLLMQKPDIKQFENQAEIFGFNKSEYLKALSKVPIIDRNKVEEIMDYLSDFSVYIAKEGLQKLRTNKLNEQLDKQNQELQKAKENAEENQNYLQTLINTIPDLIWLKDEAGIYLMSNKRFEDFFGAKEYQIIGKTDYDYINKELADFFRKNDMKAMQAGKPTMNEELITFANDGHEEFLETIKTPIYDSNKKLIGVLGIGRDITERQKAEHDLKIAKERAEESDRLKSAFLANMSHEIRTPMNGILGFADLLKEPDLTGDEQKQYVAIIEKSGQRMLNIINDLIDISKIEAGQMELIVSEANINEQIYFLYTFFKPEAESKNIKLTYEKALSNSLANIITDRGKLYAILTNLLKNAIKFTSDGKIEFGYVKKAYNIEFFVKDTGTGIAKDRQQAIFERFVQADLKISKPYEGAGLGLAITKAYIEMLGGEIWLNSDLGVGSTFYFTIPYHTKPKKPSNKNQPGTSAKQSDILQNLSILVAEDDETAYYYLEALLGRKCKTLVHCTTGLDAVEACRQNPNIDLVLMDIKMPVMDGYEATREIRKFNKNVKILAQTAYALTGDKDNAMDAGCDDYIAKPINKNDLFRIIQKLFN